jgi:hypothetical protein
MIAELVVPGVAGLAIALLWFPGATLTVGIAVLALWMLAAVARLWLEGGE